MCSCRSVPFDWRLCVYLASLLFTNRNSLSVSFSCLRDLLRLSLNDMALLCPAQGTRAIFCCVYLRDHFVTYIAGYSLLTAAITATGPRYATDTSVYNMYQDCVVPLKPPDSVFAALSDNSDTPFLFYSPVFEAMYVGYLVVLVVSELSSRPGGSSLQFGNSASPQALSLCPFLESRRVSLARRRFAFLLTSFARWSSLRTAGKQWRKLS